MRAYRIGFLLAVAGNIVLAAIVVGVWLHYRGSRPAMDSIPPTQASSGAQPSAEGPTVAPASSETPLVPVQISPQRLQSIGVKIGKVERKTVADEIRTTGNVAVDETRLAYVQVRFSGYIKKVFVNATYEFVRKGQPLFTIYSPDLVATEREYLVARQNAKEVATSRVPGISTGAASLLDAAQERLKQWGVPPEEIARLNFSNEVQQELEVDSPVSGYVIERNALAGVAVQPEMRLYTIADLSAVWVLAQVFQSDLGRIKLGDAATLTVDTFPGRTFRGRTDFIYPQVDMDTRTAKVRIIFPNPSLQLKPGMFAVVSLSVPLGRQLVIPASAVLQSGARQIAFVSRDDGYLEPREVQLGARSGDDVIILKGLDAGEQIITSANFLIDSESELQAALGSFVPPPPGAGAAAAMNVPQGTAELASDPDPPHKGSNVFRVKLADPAGAPVSGASVTVTLFMPAMPDMGMPAMRTVVNLSEKGSGTYEGSGELGSGGTWQVTVLARKGGDTIARKQLSLSSTGGM